MYKFDREIIPQPTAGKQYRKITVQLLAEAMAGRPYPAYACQSENLLKIVKARVYRDGGGYEGGKGA